MLAQGLHTSEQEVKALAPFESSDVTASAVVAVQRLELTASQARNAAALLRDHRMCPQSCGSRFGTCRMHTLCQVQSVRLKLRSNGR